MFKCPDHGYCISEACPKCPKTALKVGTTFSIDDKNGEYRRKEKWTGSSNL
jgi:rRNA maturation protein Nop10